MNVKVHTIRVSFVTKTGVPVLRTVQLRDASRANAEFRAKANAVPAGATNVTVAR